MDKVSPSALPCAPAPPEEVFLRGAALRSFSGDRLIVRDPAGRSGGPRLRAGVRGGEEGLVARGPFLIHVRYAISKAEGIAFCRATGDDNEIHSVGDVVPGAMTAARVLFPIEVIFPEIEVLSFAVKFTAIAAYGRPMHTVFRCAPEADGVRFSAATAQAGGPIAEMEARGRLAPPAPRSEVARRKVNVERLRAVRTFIQALHMSPHVWFRRASLLGYYYPRAFLASLPSGAMVRQFRGGGGLLNKLALDFEPGLRVPIAGRDELAVALESPRVERRTFNKILTAISDSIRTYVRGTALVLSREAASAKGIAGESAAALQA
jgi:hypothetical protein